MVAHSDFFYSFSIDEIKGFEEISRSAKALSQVPPDFNLSAVHDFVGKERFDRMRQSLEQAPNKEKALKHEAEAHLHKTLPKLNSAIQETNHLKGAEWSLRPGYIAYNPASNRINALNEQVDDYFGVHCECSGDFLYPTGGFRGWHTNKYDGESWTLFLIDVDKPRSSFFRFIDPETNEVITHWDEPGTVNVFKISASQLLWHCIGSVDANRWSQGFLVPDNWRDWLL